MKKIGLIGGMSWESTAHYYQWLNEGIRAREGGLASIDLLMHSFDFRDAQPLIAAGDWKALGALVSQSAAALERAGADAIALTTNTVHKIAPQIRACVHIPMIHIVEETAKALGAEKKVLLLGTKPTMEEGFFPEILERHGFEVCVPDSQAREDVNRIIFEELCQGEVRKESKVFFQEEIIKAQAQDCEAVILGCTELNMSIDDMSSVLPIYDTARIHVESLIEFALSDKEICDEILAS